MFLNVWAEFMDVLLIRIFWRIVLLFRFEILNTYE